MPMNRPTFIAGVIVAAISIIPVVSQLHFYVTCGNGQLSCGSAILPDFQFDILAVAGVLLLGLSFRFRQSMAFFRAHSTPVGFSLLLAGILLVAEGPALIGESGLFSSGSFYACFGSIAACMRGLDITSFEFWSGISLTIIGLGAIPTGVFLLVRDKRQVGQARGIFGNPSQKRLAFACLVLVTFVSLFFLTPFVPVQVDSPSQQIVGANVACYQIVNAVNNPLFIYGGYASPGQHLFGVGNAVYVSCIVTNPS